MASMRQNPPRGSSNGFHWGNAASLCFVGIGGVLLGSQLFGRGDPLAPPDPGEGRASAVDSRVADAPEEAAMALLQDGNSQSEISDSDVVKTSGEPAATHPPAQDDARSSSPLSPLRIEGEAPRSPVGAPGAEAQRVETASESKPAGASPAPADAGVVPEEKATEESDADRQREAHATEPAPEELVPASDCGMVYCNAGYVCCNHSCGTCVPQGESCDETPCTRKIQYPVSIPCGRSTCSNGQVCCNTSCGTCVEPGEACDPKPCDNPIQYPIAIFCGRSTCSSGKVCCNLSCGICVEPGETCSHELCD